MTKPVVCQMCRFYSAPGFVLNAWQIIPCWLCNPDNKLGLAVPAELHHAPEVQP